MDPSGVNAMIRKDLAGLLEQVSLMVKAQRFCRICWLAIRRENLIDKIDMGDTSPYRENFPGESGDVASWILELVEIISLPPSFCEVCRRHLQLTNESVIFRANKLIPTITYAGDLFYRCANGSPGAPLDQGGSVNWGALSMSMLGQIEEIEEDMNTFSSLESYNGEPEVIRNGIGEADSTSESSSSNSVSSVSSSSDGESGGSQQYRPT